MVAPRRYVRWWENPSALRFEDLQLPGSARPAHHVDEPTEMNLGTRVASFPAV